MGCGKEADQRVDDRGDDGMGEARATHASGVGRYTRHWCDPRVLGVTPRLFLGSHGASPE